MPHVHSAGFINCNWRFMEKIANLETDRTWSPRDHISSLGGVRRMMGSSKSAGRAHMRVGTSTGTCRVLISRSAVVVSSETH